MLVVCYANIKHSKNSWWNRRQQQESQSDPNAPGLVKESKNEALKQPENEELWYRYETTKFTTFMKEYVKALELHREIH